MSNVSPAEIVVTVARAFELLPSSFRGRFCGNWAAMVRPRPLVARQIAVMLIKRHTLASDRGICELFGLAGRPDRYKLGEQVKVAERDCRMDPKLSAIVEAVEMEIDELHERRSRRSDRSRSALTRHQVEAAARAMEVADA